MFSLVFALFCGCQGKQSFNNFPLPPDNFVEEVFPDDDDVLDEDQRKKTYILSKATGLRLRSKPSTSSAVVGQIDTNDILLYLGQEGEFYKTKYKEKTAYIHSKYSTLLQFDVGSDNVESAIDFGSQLLGYPYVWGSQRYHWGNGVLNKNFVNGEFDCSALVLYVYYITNGVVLDLTSRAQSLNGKQVEEGDLMRGDLMFFTNQSRKNKTGIERIGHVGIYFGDNYILHTASDYAVIEPISQTRWSYFICARRVV